MTELLFVFLSRIDTPQPLGAHHHTIAVVLSVMPYVFAGVALRSIANTSICNCMWYKHNMPILITIDDGYY